VGDYRPDTEDGDDEGLVDPKRWKAASFFNTVKRGVSEHWHADDDLRTRDPGGKTYGLKERLTVVHVTLNSDGGLHGQVTIIEPCGVDFLDQDAVDAFTKAAPFPAPPANILDPASGTVSFKFGFRLEPGGQPDEDSGPVQ
jgi:TonB family protein